MTHLKDTVFVLPNVILEFYGSIDDTLIDSAAQKHSQFIEQKTPLLVQANKVVQNSLQHYYYKSTDALIHSMTPNFNAVAILKVESTQAVEMVEFFDEIDKIDKNKTEEKPVAVSQTEPNPLEIIQRDLEIMVMGDDAGELAINACAANILKLQA